MPEPPSDNAPVAASAAQNEMFAVLAAVHRHFMAQTPTLIDRTAGTEKWRVSGRLDALEKSGWYGTR